jgi:hypothetical protein
LLPYILYTSLLKCHTYSEKVPKPFIPFFQSGIWFLRHLKSWAHNSRPTILAAPLKGHKIQLHLIYPQ